MRCPAAVSVCVCSESFFFGLTNEDDTDEGSALVSVLVRGIFFFCEPSSSTSHASLLLPSS